MVILLFLSGGLILPSESRDPPADLGDFFVVDGYLALLPLGLFLILNLVYSALAGLGILTLDAGVNLVLLAVLLVGLLSRRGARFGASLVFAAITLFAFLFLWARPGAS